VRHTLLKKEGRYEDLKDTQHDRNSPDFK